MLNFSKKSINKKALVPRWLKFTIIFVLVIGICFRFINLDRKAYWDDEAATSLVVSGFTRAEVYQQVYNDKVIDIEDLKKYQNPNKEKQLLDTIKSLGVEDSQHPPLYYVLARFWAQIFGASPGTMRFLSALISLLIFPCFYWLCLELFESSSVGWIAIALTSVSLFHLMFAQEAREYILWAVMILLLGATLLRAMRLPTKLNWGIYAIIVALGLYTYPLTGLVVISQGIYVIAIEKFQWTKKSSSYLFSAAIGFLAFTPWAVTMVSSFSTVVETTSHLFSGKPFPKLIQEFALNTSYIFVSATPRVYVPILILILYSIYFLCRHTTPKVWLFILTLMGSLLIPFLGIDLLKHGTFLATKRYLIPYVLSIQLTVAYLFANRILINKSTKLLSKRIWALTLFILISLGIWTNIRFLQTENGWNKGNFKNIPISRIINQSNNPLVISDMRPYTILALTHRLNSDVKFLLLPSPQLTRIPDGFSDVFLFFPSSSLKVSLMNRQDVKVERIDSLLWKLTKNDSSHIGAQEYR